MRVRFSARRVASRRVMLFIGMTRCRPARGETARGPDAIDRPPLRTFALRRRGFEPRPVRVFLSYVLFRGRFGSTRSDIGRADDDTCSGTGTGTLQVRRDRRDSKRGARRGFPTRIFPARGRHGHARRRARGRDDRRHDADRASSPPVVVRTGAGRARAPRSRRRQRLRRDDHGPPMGRGERPSPGGPRPRPSRRPALELETPRHGGRGAATRRRRAEGVVGRGTYHPSVTTTTHQRPPPRDGDCHDTPSPRTSARPRKTQPPPPPFGFSRLSPEVRPTLTRPSPLSDSSLPTF